ncbi:MAG: hypothetical protein AAB402_02360 [Patescibacteria group bacterium]
MKKDPQIIAKQINTLVIELASLAGVPATHRSVGVHKTPKSQNKDMSGATGGIRLLVEEGKIDSPKQLTEIIEFLRQEGRHYSRSTISMGLLNLVRERVLTRFRDKDDKNWKYVVRK